MFPLTRCSRLCCQIEHLQIAGVSLRQGRQRHSCSCSVTAERNQLLVELSDGGGNNTVSDKTVWGRWCCPPLLFGISFRRLTLSVALLYYAILLVYTIQYIIYFETYVYGGSIFTFYSPARQTASVC